MANNNRAPTPEQTAAAKKLIGHLRSQLLGMAAHNKEWYPALAALEMAVLAHRNSFRRNGEPYIIHPVTVALYCMTLPSLMFPLRTVCASLLHDVLEDEDVSSNDMRAEMGSEITDDVIVLSKRVDRVDVPYDAYKRGLGLSPVGSIGKGSDRAHNMRTMSSAFSLTKQASYLLETVDDILPMLKVARRKFPQQHQAYESIKLVLNTEVEIVRGQHAAIAVEVAKGERLRKILGDLLDLTGSAVRPRASDVERLRKEAQFVLADTAPTA